MRNHLLHVMVMLAIVAGSAGGQVILEENFDQAAEFAPLESVVHPETGEPLDEGVLLTIIPEGWTITAELRPEDDTYGADWPYPGWTALFDFEWDTQGGNRDMEVPGFEEGIMVADSDLFGNRGARSWLQSPIVDVDSTSIIIEFDSHYRHNDYQLVGLDVTWDEGDTYENIFEWSDADHSDNQNYIEHVIRAVTVPDGASTVGLQFRFMGDDNQDGFHDFDWYWAIDNVVVTEADISKPQTPQISISMVDPASINSDVILTGSTFTSPSGANHNKTAWEVALDENFENLLFFSETTSELTELTLPNSKIPFEKSIYARVKYQDDNGAYSDFSASEEFQLSPPPELKVIHLADFESTEEGELPPEFKQVSLNDGTVDNENYNIFSSWAVITPETMATFGGDRVNTPVYEGKSVYTNSDGFSPYHETHLLTQEIDLTGVTNVWLTFDSNYVQNQDNIGVLEYSVDGGDLSDDGTASGTWLPLLYMLEEDDIAFHDDGTPNAAETFTEDNIADGTSFPYSFYVFAEPLEELDEYISPRVNDDKFESKRFERFRLEAADEQSSVVIRWMNMGTNSWFWGLDNITLWGDDGTPVQDWSLY